MNDTELREQFDRWAGPLRAAPPPDFAVIRRRVRHRLARLGAAAGSALTVAGLAVGLAVAGLGGTARPAAAGLWGAARYPAPPGQPYVYVASASGTGPAQIRDAASGAVVSTLRPLGDATSFGSVAAAPGDRLFVLTQQTADDQVSFAEARIGRAAAGQEPTVRLTAVLPDLVLALGTETSDMTVNASGTRLALAVASPGGQASLVVFDLVSGQLIGSWPISAPGIFGAEFVHAGDELAVFWPVTSSSGRPAGLSLRVVDTTSAFHAGSSFRADSSADHSARGGFGTLSQDGSVMLNTQNGALFGETIGSASSVPAGIGGNGKTALLIETATATGKLVRAIPLGPASAQQSQYFCGVLWASANGRDLLTQCGSRQQEVAGGRVTRVRLAWLFSAQPDQNVTGFAW